MIGVKRILTDVVDFLELISPRRYKSYSDNRAVGISRMPL